MVAEIIPFPHSTPHTQPLAQFIRIGESGYNKLANLHASGRLPARRVVVDASKVINQRELIGAFRAAGAEIVLDTKAAELSAQSRFGGYPKGAPWATLGAGGPLAPEIFSSTHRGDIFGAIARFAIQQRIDVVLAPGHYLQDPAFPGWFEVDRVSCISLRRALDREGGDRIAIDYSLITPRTTLEEDESRSTFTHGLVDLPFDNLWIRASGFGNDASPLATLRFIKSLSALHNLGKPIIADYLGGQVGLAVLAFGAVSGIAHGIGERERFDASEWHKPAKQAEDGRQHGKTTRVAIPGLDRSLTVREIELLAGARGGRRLIVCNDRRCCLNGQSDMTSDPRRHTAFQCTAAFEDLSAVPDLNRETHLLTGRLADSFRLARQVKELRPSPSDAARLMIDADALMKRLGQHATRQEKMKSTLEHLHEDRGDRVARARAATLRAASKPNSTTGRNTK